MMENVSRQKEKEPLAFDGQDVRLTVVGWGDGNTGEDEIDLWRIGENMRAMLGRWLCVAVGFACLAAAVGFVVHQYFLAEDIKALVSFSKDSLIAEYNVRKIKSPSVVEDALNTLNMDIQSLETIRNAITIQGIIPDSAQDHITMYYDVFSQSGMSTIATVDSLLNTQYDVSRYIISLDYHAAKMSRSEGLDFMNVLLRAYQDYFAENYNYNEAMGNALNAVDYREYDYAEAVNIFSTALDSLTSYLSTVENTGTASFRSVDTGFSFADLRRAASTLRNIDLDRVSSYIVIHSVSSYDAETEISYYAWLIENLTRQRAVERTRLASLTKSIDDYEKDPILIAVQDGNSVVANMQDLNANYDNMITEKLNSQARIASYSRSISYYESVIEGFQSAEAATPEDVAKVERYLSGINEKLNTLIKTAAQTVDEYYDRVAFSNRIRVLIPASAKPVPLISKIALLSGIAAAVVVLGIFFMLAFVSGIKEQSTQDRTEKKGSSRKSAEQVPN